MLQGIVSSIRPCVERTLIRWRKTPTTVGSEIVRFQRQTLDELCLHMFGHDGVAHVLHNNTFTKKDIAATIGLREVIGGIYEDITRYVMQKREFPPGETLKILATRGYERAKGALKGYADLRDLQIDFTPAQIQEHAQTAVRRLQELQRLWGELPQTMEALLRKPLQVVSQEPVPGKTVRESIRVFENVQKAYGNKLPTTMVEENSRNLTEFYLKRQYKL